MNTPVLPLLAPIERVTLNELAYARLKQALVSGRIEPGTTLTLRQLAEQLGTSMMPVREAVTRLTAENALVVMPKRGIRVPQLSDEEAEDVWSLRVQLEGEACARAARHISAEELSEVGTLADDLQAAGDAGDLHAVLERNNAFQFAIYRAARSPVLLQMIELLRLKSVPHCTAAIRVMLRERPDYYHQSWLNHAALVAALAAHDAPRARREKQSDIRAFRAFVRDVARRANAAAGPKLVEEDPL